MTIITAEQADAATIVTRAQATAYGRRAIARIVSRGYDVPTHLRQYGGWLVDAIGEHIDDIITSHAPMANADVADMPAYGEAVHAAVAELLAEVVESITDTAQELCQEAEDAGDDSLSDAIARLHMGDGTDADARALVDAVLDARCAQ